jgi:hypothetical protein
VYLLPGQKKEKLSEVIFIRNVNDALYKDFIYNNGCFLEAFVFTSAGNVTRVSVFVNWYLTHVYAS